MAEQEALFDDKPLHPGEHLRRLMEERGGTQDDLASITGRSRQQINDIMSGRRGITPEMAMAFATVFGTSAEFWMKLDSDYRLANASEDVDAVRRAANLYSLAPIKEMQRRGWIKPAKDAGEIEQELKSFFGLSILDAPPEFPIAFRKTAPLADLTPAQRAWCFRAKNLASALQVPPYDPSRLPAAKKRLRQLAAFAANTEKVAETLAGYGVRFLVIEPLASGRIDGVAFWLDERSPVIALSLRYDRIDAFWFTLMHELAHIEHGDGLSIDTDLVGESESPPLMKEEMELRADSNAVAALVPPTELESFIRRIGPTYSKERIIQFAHRIKMHPAIIVGQLQHRGEISYGAHRELLVKVKERVIQTSLTDGWGHRIGPGVNPNGTATDATV